MIDEICNEELFAKIEDQFFDIPFGNSEFQINNFVIADQITPGRAYRTIGLNIIDKMNNLRDAEYRLKKQKLKIKIKEMKRNEQVYDFEQELFDLKMNKLKQALPGLLKLVHDAQVEFAVYYQALKQMPEYTRESFEAEEQTHYLLNLQRQMQNPTGPEEALHTMTADTALLAKLRETPEFLKKTMIDIRNMQEGQQLEYLTQLGAGT